MKIYSEETVNEAYRKLMLDLSLHKGTNIDNTCEINNCILEIKKPTLNGLNFFLRPLSEKYANAELEWYWTGDNSCKTIGAHAKKWLQITDDGETSNSAYGYILFKKYSKNQLEELISLLEKVPTSRRAVLNISDPTVDKINTKDMQCTIFLQFLIRDKKLHTIACMRSNDIFYGFPYDYIFFVSIAKYIARRLNLELGTYTHFASSMHLYNSSVSKLREDNTYYNIDTDKYYNMYETLYKPTKVNIEK